MLWTGPWLLQDDPVDPLIDIKSDCGKKTSCKTAMEKYEVRPPCGAAVWGAVVIHQLKPACT